MDEATKTKLLARLLDGRASGVSDPSACWLWQLSLDPGGYGAWTVAGLSTKKAHRISWMLHRGPIPDGRYVDHMCRNRACVNPNHLRVVTPAVNSLQNSEGVSAKMHDKEDCDHGHGPLTQHPYVPNKRYCATCAAERNRANQRRRRDLGITPQTPIQPMCRKGLHRHLDDDGEPTADLLVRSDGRRECRGCHREREADRRRRARGDSEPVGG